MITLKRAGLCLLILVASALALPAQQLTYQLDTTPPTVLAPGSTISLPNANVGDTSSLIVRILNATAANATVGSVAVTGTGFQLSQVPLLPVTLAPGGSVTVTVSFTPTRASTVTGSLVINNSDTFILSGLGLASQLVYSYTTAGTTITLGTNNTSVVFSPVVVSQSSQIVFDVKNAGTLPVVISNIGIGQAPSPYSLAGLPPLPINLQAGADFQFTIIFQPTTVGFANGTLQIDTTSIPLIGSGTLPPTLPSYSIAVVSGQVTARSQPNIGLTLSAPYPVAISGNLSLVPSGNLPTDPAVQFATGGRTVPFVIPANSTTAIFGGAGSSIGFQTGTVASTITFAASFATLAGQITLNPTNATPLQITIPTAAPTLIGIQLAGQTTNGFSISVTGFSTTRTLSNWNVQFATAAGFSMPKSQFTIDISQVSLLWFQSAGSQPFGGQFILTVPFTFQAALPAGESIVSALASVSVNVSNELGTSNTVLAKIP